MRLQVEREKEENEQEKRSNKKRRNPKRKSKSKATITSKERLKRGRKENREIITANSRKVK